jgi:regulator of replication initiation timing
MNIETWLSILSLILGSSVLTSIGNAYFGRRKNSVEIEDKINEMALRLMEEYRGEIDRLTDKIATLGEKYELMKLENAALKVQLSECTNKDEIDKLSKRIRGLGG